MPKTKQYTLSLTERQAKLLTAALLFSTSTDVSGNWPVKASVEFVEIAEKLAKLGVTDLSSLIEVPADGMPSEYPRLLKRIKKNFKATKGE